MMPHRISNAALRLQSCRLVLEMMRAGSMAYFGDERFGAHADDMVLYFAIMIGQFEHRPMKAAKLAHYVGMPRATVVRKLKTFEKRGLVSMVDGVAIVPVEIFKTVDPVPTHDMIRPAITRLAMELSKMDTLSVATATAPP